MRRGLLCVALLCGVCSVANASLLRRDEPEPASVAPEAAPVEEGAEEEPAATGSEYLRDFPHDRTFHDHADKTIPSHKHMMDVAKDVKKTQDVKLMLSQLDVLRSYLTKLSVRHEFLMEKYHAVLEGGEDKKLRRMVAEIVGDELKKREAERESIVQEIVEKVVGILKDDLGLDAGAVDDADKPDDKLQQEAIQEAVADALKQKQDVEDNEQTEEADAGASDRVLDDFDEEGEEEEDAEAEKEAAAGVPAEEGEEDADTEEEAGEEEEAAEAEEQ